jgi:hypothetical protein
MSETRPRFQFGLRKLLLWTAVLALLLGVAQMLGELGAFLACGIIIVFVIRTTAGSIVALAFAEGLGIGAMIGHSFPITPIQMIIGCVLGSVVGLIVFCIAEVSCRAVDWADNLMASKTDEREE